MELLSELYENPRKLCEGHRDMLRELTRIHLMIDAPNRRLRTDESELTLRLRKVGLHALAIGRWEVTGDAVHVMSTEVRAAYAQMDAVWKSLPEECRVDEMYDSWWSDEARVGLLAKYDHPTPMGLLLPIANGGLAEAEDPASYASLALWLGRLGLGYGIALTHLATVVHVETDVDSDVTAVMRRWTIPSGIAWRTVVRES